MKAWGGVFPEGLGTSASLCRAHPLRTGAPNSSREISGTVTVTSSHLLVRYCPYPLSAYEWRVRRTAGQGTEKGWEDPSTAGT